MAGQENRLSWVLDWKVDQNSYNQVINQLKQISSMNQTGFNKTFKIKVDENDFRNAQNSAEKLAVAMKKSYNANLGTMNLSRLRQELDSLGGSKGLQKIQKEMSKLGQVGENAFHNFTSNVMTTNIQLKQSHKLLNDMATSMKNTIKWGVTSSIFNNLTGSIQGAWEFTKKLDTSLNDIRIVTGKSSDEMAKFAREANKAAAALGKTTTDYTEASLIYYQQGLAEQDVRARTETTLKTANVTGQSTSAVSEQLTAVWNGYKVQAAEAELYVDKLAAVAATTASDLEELSIGMSKVASAANLMGVDVDQLNAQLATIVSVTRQAPESVGTALKTIYARMGDIEAGID